MLNRLPEAAIDFAVRTILNLRESCEWATKEERKDLVHVIIQEVGVDMVTKCIPWIKARPDYEPLFSILDNLHLDNERRYWIERREVEGNNCDIKENAGQMATEVKIAFPVSHNT